MAWWGRIILRKSWKFLMLKDSKHLWRKMSLDSLGGSININRRGTRICNWRLMEYLRAIKSKKCQFLFLRRRAWSEFRRSRWRDLSRRKWWLKGLLHPSPRSHHQLRSVSSRKGKLLERKLWRPDLRKRKPKEWVELTTFQTAWVLARW